MFPYAWNDDHRHRVGVLPARARAADVRWFDVEPCYVFHPLNAYDDGERVVLDVVRHPSMFRPDLRGPNEGAAARCGAGRSTRRAGTVKEEQLDDRAMSSPGSTSGSVGRPHRYGWAATLARRRRPRLRRQPRSLATT